MATPTKQEYTGKTHKWGSPATTISAQSASRKLIALTPTVIIITTTILFNKSQSGLRAYDWLNANYTPFQINSIWSFGITTMVYWLAGLVYVAMDMWEPLRKRLEPWKIQAGARISWKDYRDVFVVVAKNQLLVALPLTLVVAQLRPLRTTAPLPGAWETIGTFLFCLACEEAGFYYVHRFFHSPMMYKRFHKLHHQFVAPVALASTYCTGMEHLFSNLLPILLGIAFLGSHWSLMMMFFCALELATLQTHSGYNFPGTFDALQHDWHHYSFTENFGPTGALDTLHGTNKVFKSWLNELELRYAGKAREVGSKELAEKESRGETL